MSTFDGIVAEFPTIRIDHFLPSSDPRPTVGFVSHAHTDHTAGLASFGSRFVYCSAITREVLLNLETRYSRRHRAAKRLEQRNRHFSRLENKLRALPLETPTLIEVDLNEHIQVTLFDANHCLGSVSFLIQNDKTAVFYTGDVRAEKWWVDALVRQPTMVPFTHGTKTLNTLYLDTSFMASSRPLRRVPAKADGLAELLKTLDMYPKDTRFYFHYATLGYEDIWVALVQALGSRVHVCPYRFQLLSSGQGTRSRAMFAGFELGNMHQEGILTRDAGVRLHSCETDTSCRVYSDPATVHIRPVASSIDAPNRPSSQEAHFSDASLDEQHPSRLPRTIRFPYSRHSSYQEVAYLTSRLRPRDVWPCTAPLSIAIKQDTLMNMETLFGNYCSTKTFRWDQLIPRTATGTVPFHNIRSKRATTSTGSRSTLLAQTSSSRVADAAIDVQRQATRASSRATILPSRLSPFRSTLKKDSISKARSTRAMKRYRQQRKAYTRVLSCLEWPTLQSALLL